MCTCYCDRSTNMVAEIYQCLGLPTLIIWECSEWSIFNRAARAGVTECIVITCSTIQSSLEDVYMWVGLEIETVHLGK